MGIGVRLKEERSLLCLNQIDMATADEVDKTTQINYEKGSGAPDAFYLATVECLGVDVLYVVTGARNRSRRTASAAPRRICSNTFACCHMVSRATPRR